MLRNDRIAIALPPDIAQADNQDVEQFYFKAT